MSTADTCSAQVGVLGSMLISPELVGEVLTRVRPDDFLDDQCREVFMAIRAVFAEGKPVDPVCVRDKLGGPGDAAWSKYIFELMEYTPTAANIWEYVPIMRSQARVHKIAHIGAQLQGAQDEARQRELIAQLNGLLSERQDVRSMDMAQMLRNFYARHQTRPDYLIWGLPKLDERLCTEQGDFVVLGGYPSAGKTALAVEFAWRMAQGRRVGFFSLETSQYKLADRLIANLSGIPMQDIKHAEISQEQWETLTKISPHITARSLEVVEASGMTAADITSYALSRRYDIVMVDYLQIVEPESRRANRAEQVGGISRALQQLAHRNGITVLALAQLSRADSDDHEPTMADLRESGQIEQDADIIMLLYLEEPQRAEKSRRILKIAKNKDGERGRIFLVLDGDLQRFRESVIDQEAPSTTPRKYRPRQKQYTFDDFPPEEDPFKPTGTEM